MSDAWKQWEGQVVNGEFPLLRYLGGSEQSAVFLTERHEGENLLKAAIKLIPAAGESDELQLSRWRLASELSHPHLISLFEMGRCELGNAALLYVVMECAEENLAQVLPSRALTPAEVRAMLDPVLDVLAYLHGSGFVHGHIKPSNILANGDDLKVSSDELRREGDPPDGFGKSDAYDPPENARGAIPVVGGASPAGDVWSLGMTLVETLTQNLPAARAAQQAGERSPERSGEQSGEQRDLLIPQTLPEPFLDIARHCLVRHPQGRWTIAQIAGRLQGRIPVSQAQSPAGPPQAAARPPEVSKKHHKYSVAIAAGLALAAVLAGAGLLRRETEHSSELSSGLPSGLSSGSQTERQSGAPQTPAVALEQPTIQPSPKQETQEPQERSTARSEPRAADKRQESTKPVPVPTSVHLRAPDEEAANAAARRPASAAIRGEVAKQVLPDVLESARDSIRGTVRVSVAVDVDRSGNVDGAELKSSGPSKYFARQAMQAAQLWKFKPPEISGHSILSSWTLRFEFTRSGTTVSPTQEIP